MDSSVAINREEASRRLGKEGSLKVRAWMYASTETDFQAPIVMMHARG